MARRFFDTVEPAEAGGGRTAIVQASRQIRSQGESVEGSCPMA